MGLPFFLSFSKSALGLRVNDSQTVTYSKHSPKLLNMRASFMTSASALGTESYVLLFSNMLIMIKAVCQSNRVHRHVAVARQF